MSERKVQNTALNINPICFMECLLWGSNCIFVLFKQILDFKGLNAVHTYLIVIGGNT